MWNPIGNGSNLLVRRDLALAVDGYNPDYARAGIGGCEDLEFQLKVLRRSKMEIVREFLVGYRLHAAQMSGDIVRMRLSKLAVIETIVGDGEMAARTRKRALVQAHMTLAKGYLLVGDWRAATKSVLTGFAVSPTETVRKFRVFFGRELGYLMPRVRHLLRPSTRPADAVRSFGEFDPCEGVDANPRHKVRYRSSLARQAEARFNRRANAGLAQPGRTQVN